jgi:hypothetical protein
MDPVFTANIQSGLVRAAARGDFLHDFFAHFGEELVIFEEILVKPYSPRTLSAPRRFAYPAKKH